MMKPTLRVLMLFACTLLFQLSYGQNRPVSGKILDDKGLPLIGASITASGTKTNALTDANGAFTINVPEATKTLTISYVGMKSQAVTIAGKTSILISLQAGDSKLNDVVVVGYGTTKRVNLTTAQSSVSAKDIERTVNTTVEQAIQGRAAGVYVTQNSGQPGGGISVSIRGVSTINGSNEPLYVVDGVQIESPSISFGARSSSNPLAGLNPSDIDNVQVLQGPSATAIYGSRGTNGVVLITTKRGKLGDAKLNYNFQHSEQTTPKNLDVMDLQQYAQLVNDVHTVTGDIGGIPGEFLDPTLLGKGTNWQKELFRTAPMNKHSLSLSGGGDKTTYFMSGEYLNQEGVALGSGFNRYSFRVNLDNKPRDWATIGVNLAFNQTKENLTNSQENVIQSALQLTPQIPVKNIEGDWGGGDITNAAIRNENLVNPIAISSLITNKNVRRQMLGGLNLGINLAKGLTFRSSLNANVGYGNSDYYVPKYTIGWAHVDKASLTEVNSTNTYWNWNQLLEYNKQLGNHNIGLMVSHEAQQSNWKNVGASRTGFLTNDILDLSAGDVTTSGTSGGSGHWGMESYLGRLNYNYDNRYVLVGTIRRDGSSNFGENNRWGTFPSLSAAWRISKEHFFDVPAISELKLRIETGLTGNQGGGGIYSPLNAGATPSGVGFLPAVYKNPDLKWEETNTNNIGLNLGMFKDRITVEFDYYVRKTNNLLMQNPLPWYMGTNGNGAVGSPTVNIGALNNKGWGLTINTVNIDRKSFKWESSLNLSAFKTKITKFYSDAAFVERSSWWLGGWTQRSAVGEAPWLFRGYIEEGLFKSIDEINNSAVPVENGLRIKTDQQEGIWVGDVKYKDISGPKGEPDGVIDTYDQTNIGNPWPKLFGGFTNNFTYKNFELSVLITSTYGNDIFNYVAKNNTNPNNVYNGVNAMVHTLEYARPVVNPDGSVGLANPETDVARIHPNDKNGSYARTTNKFVEDGSFIRLKNINLSYNLPNSLLVKQKLIKGIRATVGVQNIYTITGYSGFDPEVGSYVGRDASASNQAIGLDFGRYPLTPVYTFNLSVNF